MEKTEQQIIQLLLAGDQSAIPLIYDHYADSLYGVVFRMLKNEEEAKDVFQESLIKMWKKGNTYNPSKSRLFTWMLAICRNTALDRLRSIQRKQDREIQISDSNVYQLQTKEKVNIDAIDLNDHLDRLEPKYRSVIDVLFYKGMSQQEASEYLGIPLGTVKTRLRIGLRMLKEVYGDLLVYLIIAVLYNL